MPSYFRHLLLALIAGIFIVCATDMRAQKGDDLNFSFRHFSVNEGLRDHRVVSLVENSGFLWVGTYYGISRFDGYTFTDFDATTPQGPLSERRISRLFNLQDGRAGIVHSPSLTSIPRACAIVDFTSGSIASADTVLSGDTLLALIDTAGQRWEVSDPALYQEERLAFRDNKGNVLRIGDDRMSQFSLAMTGVDTHDVTEAWKAVGGVQCAGGSDFGRAIFLGTLNGLIRVNLQSSPFRSYLNEQILPWEYKKVCRSIMAVDDRLIVSLEDHSLREVDPAIGSADPYMPVDELSGQPLPVHNVRGFTEEGDSALWVTGFDGLLGRINLKSNTYRDFSSPEYGRILTATRAGHQLVLACQTAAGYELFTFDLATFSLVPLSLGGAEHLLLRRSAFLLPGEGDSLWYATVQGLFLLDLSDRRIISAYVDPGNVMDSTSAPFAVQSSLTSANVLALYLDSHGKLWIGLENGGVNMLDTETGYVRQWGVEDGLPHQTVCGILPDATGLWLSTYNGLTHFDTATLYFKNFTIDNGLPHNEFNRFSFTRGPDSTYYFGTMNGLVAFNPGQVLGTQSRDKLLVSEAVLTSRDGKTPRVIRSPDALAEVIVIPANSRSCSFALALSDFSNAETNTYQYRVVSGWSNPDRKLPWNSIGRNRTLRLDYLPAGDHTIDFRGISVRGMLTEVTSLRLHVRQNFYKSWWFISACIALAMLTGYLIYRYRLAQALKIERLRTKLSSDLHDDVGGLLSGVAYQMELLEHTADDEHKSLIRSVAASSRRAMSKMRDVVWAIDSRKSTFQDLVERMQEFAEETLAPLQIDYRIHSNGMPEDREISTEVRHNVLLIYKEFVSNTIKHANANAVHVRFERRGKGLSLDMRDNGVGRRDAEKTTTGQGLRNMQMRAAKINGSITFQDQEGFSAVLTIPGI